MKHLIFLSIMGFALASCGGELQVNLVINDPCNQQVLSESDYIAITVESDDLGDPERTTFSQNSHEGQLSGISPVDNAIMSIDIQPSAGSSGPSSSITASISAGPLNLSGLGESNPITLNLAPGLIGRFAQTTRQQGVCSNSLTARRGHTATVLPDGRIFIVGGELISGDGITHLKSTEFYNPRINDFEPGPDLPGGPRKDHTATLLPSGEVLIAGGTGLITSSGITAETTLLSGLLFDYQSNTFTNTQNVIRMNASRSNHTATLLSDGSVIFIGGTYSTGSATFLTSIEFWHPDEGSYTLPGVELVQGRAFHQTILLPEGDGVAIIGGKNRTEVLESIELYRNGQIIQGPSMTTARVHHDAILLPSKNTILITGGYDDIEEGPPFSASLNTMELFLLPSSQLSGGSIAPCNNLQMRTNRAFHKSALLPDGTVLLTGGIASTGMPTDSAEIVNIQTVNSCSLINQETTSPMVSDHAQHTIATMAGGHVFIFGGYVSRGVGSNLDSSNIAEYYPVLR